jgi:hypothetical protein
LSLEVELRLDAREFGDWINYVRRRLPEVFDELLGRSGDIIAGIMRERSPVKTGFLRNSIVTRRGRDTVEVFPTAPYAPYVEFGTSPHIIFPVSANVLAFEFGGQTVFAKHVQHPGFPGRFFVKATREEALPQIRTLAYELCRWLFGGSA